MPAMVKPTPAVSIVVDTSGSMSEDDLNMAVGEIRGILMAMGNRTASYYAVDADVHVAKKISAVSQVELKGGGGTSMPVGIERAVTDKPKPDVLIVITDGYTDWDETPPPCKLICCMVNEEMQGPSYAKTVNIPPTKRPSLGEPF
jgi:predicted metal-dependent peptidase